MFIRKSDSFVMLEEFANDAFHLGMGRDIYEVNAYNMEGAVTISSYYVTIISSRKLAFHCCFMSLPYCEHQALM